MQTLFSLFIVIITLLLSVPCKANWLGWGTQSDPYQISTVAHLEALADSVDKESGFIGGRYFKLMNDIIDPPVTRVIGKGVSHGFRANFDGNGHTINLAINETSGDAALFGMIGGLCSGGFASIKNLTLTGYVKAPEYTGGIAAQIQSCGCPVEITNCINAANVTGGLNGNWSRTGGIAGMISGNNIIISHCINVGNISSGCVGGIVGNASFTGGAEIHIINCSNYGYILGLNSNTGGIVGLLFNYGGNSSIANCISTGVVEGGFNIGGIVGRVLP